MLVFCQFELACLIWMASLDLMVVGELDFWCWRLLGCWNLRLCSWLLSFGSDMSLIPFPFDTMLDLVLNSISSLTLVSPRLQQDLVIFALDHDLGRSRWFLACFYPIQPVNFQFMEWRYIQPAHHLVLVWSTPPFFLPCFHFQSKIASQVANTHLPRWISTSLSSGSSSIFQVWICFLFRRKLMTCLFWYLGQVITQYSLSWYPTSQEVWAHSLWTPRGPTLHRKFPSQQAKVWIWPISQQTPNPARSHQLIFFHCRWHQRDQRSRQVWFACGCRPAELICWWTGTSSCSGTAGAALPCTSQFASVSSVEWVGHFGRADPSWKHQLISLGCLLRSRLLRICSQCWFWFPALDEIATAQSFGLWLVWDYTFLDSLFSSVFRQNQLFFDSFVPKLQESAQLMHTDFSL